MTVEIRDTGPWTELRLERPPRNVLDVPMLCALRDALDRLKDAGAPLLLLRASGRHFSTGYDIADIPAEIFDPDPAVRTGHPFEQVMARLVEYPSPVVALVQGDAYGGAVEVLACADLRVAAEGVRVGLPPVRLGLVYSHTGLRRLLRAFGPALTREMLLTGEAVAAERAQAAGFFCRVVPARELEAATAALLTSLSRGGPQALRGTRRVLNLLEEAETLPAPALAEIAALRHAARHSEDFAAAQAAFLARRPSPFGRGPGHGNADA
jgi:enoyl-CoA hydratase/carnithine racemase